MSPSIRTTPSAPPSRPFRLPRPESDIGGPSYRVKASDPQSKTHKNVHPRAEAPSSKRQPRPRTPSPHHRHMSSGTWVVTFRMASATSQMNRSGCGCLTGRRFGFGVSGTMSSKVRGFRNCRQEEFEGFQEPLGLWKTSLPAHSDVRGFRNQGSGFQEPAVPLTHLPTMCYQCSASL